MIRVFPTTSTIFASNGIGVLKDSISCYVTEEGNGAFELEMEYPISGRYYKELAMRRIIVAKPNPYDDPQPFRIYGISKPISGIVTINAAHISYDMSGYAVSPFVATSISTALTNMKNASSTPCPFTFWTNKTNTGELKVIKPTSMRSLLGNEILTTYGAEYEFDNYNVKVHDKRGQNRGVSIRYGKNLTDLKQEENCSSVFTGIYPYWYSEEKGLITLPQKIVNASGTYDFTRIYPVDITQQFQDPPTYDQILEAANNYMIENNIGVPKISLSLSFVQLNQFIALETVKLFDTLTVEFVELGVAATAKCVKTKYNVLTDKYESLELGDAVSNIATTIVDNKKIVDKKLNEVKVNFSAEVDTIKIGLADIEDAMIDKADIKYLEAGYAHLINGYIDNAQIKEASIYNGMIDRATVNRLIVESGDIKEASIHNAHIDRAGIDRLVVVTADIQDGSITNAKIDRASINKLIVTDADIDNVNAGKIKAGYLSADRIEALTITGDKIKANTITADKLDTQSINTQYAHISNGEIDNAVIDVANIKNMSVDYAHITNGVIDNARIGHASVDGLSANYAHILNGKIDNATIDVAKIDNLSANYAHISNGVIDNAKIDYTKINNLNANYVHITDGFIDNAQIKLANISDLSAIKISSDQFTSNTIDTSKVTILGPSGKLRFANNRIQVFDKQTTPVERVSIGDVNGDGTVYGFRVRGADGVTTLMDETGVHNEGITDGAITNDKISDTADIEGSKLLENSTPGSKLVIGAIETRYIASEAVTADKIKANEITSNHLQTGSVTASKIDTRGLTVSSEVNGILVNTFSVDSLGKVEMAGVVKSYDYNPTSHTGWYIDPDGNAEFNNTVIRGRVILPNAGMVDDYNPSQTIGRNLIFNTDNYTGGMGQTYYNISDDWKISDRLVTGTYTISFKYSITAATSIRVSLGTATGLNNTVVYDGSWELTDTLVVGKDKYYTKQITFTRGTQTHLVIQVNNNIDFWNLKVETGPATEWSAAPEDDPNPVRIWAGTSYESRNLAPFRVLQDGNVFIKDGTFSGKIIGGSIDIGNIHISDTNSTSAVFKINNNGDTSTIIRLAEDTSYINTPFSVGSTFSVNGAAGITQVVGSDLIVKPNATDVSVRFNNNISGTIIEMVNNKYNIKVNTDGSCGFNSKTSNSYADYKFQRLDSTDAVVTDGVVVEVNGELSVTDKINMQTMYMQKNVSTGGVQFIFI